MRILFSTERAQTKPETMTQQSAPSSRLAAALAHVGYGSAAERGGGGGSGEGSSSRSSSANRDANPSNHSSLPASRASSEIPPASMSVSSGSLAPGASTSAFAPRSLRDPPPMPPSPSSISQSDDNDEDEEEEDEEEEEDFEDLHSSSIAFGGQPARLYANGDGRRAESSTNGGRGREVVDTTAASPSRGKGKAMDQDAGLEYSPESTIDRRNTITSRNGVYPLAGVTASGSRTSLLLRPSNGGPLTPGPGDSTTYAHFDTDDAQQAGLPLAQDEPASVQEACLLPFNPAAADSLPHEIMLHIFKYTLHSPSDLRRCILVCKSWCLSGVELLWHRPAFYKASSLYKMVHTLSLPNQSFEYATFIRRLNFSVLGDELDNATFQRMASCVRLERLTLTGCSQLTDAHLAKVVEKTKQLVAIDLTDVVHVGDETIRRLAAGCSRLHGINLTRCANVSSAAIAELGRNCKMLRRVKLCEGGEIGDDAVGALAENCPLLLEIDLAGCSKVTDESMAKLWTHSSQIREFRLSQCTALTDAGFPNPLSGKRRRDAVLSNGIVRAPLVPDRALDQRDAADLHSLPGAIPLRSFDHLRVLDLTNCAHITDHAIEGIINNAPKIRNLVLAKCSLLTDETIYSISSLGKNLHYLHLGRVDR